MPCWVHTVVAGVELADEKYICRNIIGLGNQFWQWQNAKNLRLILLYNEIGNLSHLKSYLFPNSLKIFFNRFNYETTLIIIL